MDAVINYLPQIQAMLESKQGAIGLALAFLFGISKRFSNEGAGPIAAKIQLAFDGVAKLLLMAGDLLKLIAKILSNAIRSDGYGGKP